MKVMRAEAMGFCFGVRDALKLTEQIPNPDSVTIHGQLIHNETVLHQLDARGFRSNEERERRPLPQTPDVLITAHGISDAERRRLEAAGKQLIDTTCPLVRRVHEAAQKLDRDGYHVLVVGRRGHVEVQGIIEDLSEYDIVQSVEEVRRYPQSRLGLICQSTTPPRTAEAIHEAIREQNPHAEVRFINTICHPTRDRQEAVRRLAQQVPAMVVVGGRNSNNTRALAELCREQGVPTLHVQSAADLDPAWFEGYEVVGLTAGTSTLDSTIDEVHEALCNLHAEVAS